MGNVLNVVMYLQPFPAGQVTCVLHPEASPCP